MRKVGVLLLLVLAALGYEGSAAARVPGLTRFTNGAYGMTFLYPSEWRPQWVGSELHYLYTVVALSNEQLPKSRCTVTRLPTGDTEVRCSLRPQSLPPGGVFVQWIQNWGPIPTDVHLTHYPGTPTRIGRLPAKILIDPDGTGPEQPLCPGQSTGSITVVIAVKAHGYYWPLVMSACANTTDFPSFQHEVLAMLDSVSFRP